MSLLRNALRYIDENSPPPNETIVPLMFAAGILLLYSSVAMADTMATGNQPVTAGDVASILGLIVTFLLSAVTLAYTVGIQRQKLNDVERRTENNERVCANIGAMNAKLDLILAGKIRGVAGEEGGKE